MRKVQVVFCVIAISVLMSCGGKQAQASGGVYLPLRVGKMYSYYNIEKDILGNDVFRYAGSFNDQHAVVINKSGEYGIIDSKMKIIVLKGVTQVLDFSNGLAAARIDGKWGYIDELGRWVIKPQYTHAERFYDGLAIVGIGPGGFPRKFITPEDKAPFSRLFEQDSVPYSFSEGYARIGSSGSINYIDKTGKEISKNTFKFGYSFSDGVAAVAVSVGETEKWGFVDGNGDWQIEPRYDDADSFSEGLAAVRIENDYYLIDHKGRAILLGEYEKAYSPHYGIVRFKKNGMYGFVLQDGKMIHEADIEEADDFDNGLAKIAKTIDDGETSLTINGYMRSDGSEIWGDTIVP